MGQRVRIGVRIGLGVLLLAVPLYFVACGGGGDGGGGGVGAPARGLWVVADNTFADNVADTLVAAPDNLYYNVHTASNPGGEIRGQLVGTGTVLVTTLTGLQEVNQGDTAAYGAGVLSVDNVAGRVRGFVVAANLTGPATAVQIRNAARGLPSNPVILTLTGGPNVWVVPDNTSVDNVAAIVAVYNAAPDNLYFNVLTAAYPDGAIRGQLDTSGAVRLATLSGAQETALTTATLARGAGILVVDNVTNRIGGFLLTSGLAGTAAHVHNAARGVAGPIIADEGNNVALFRPGAAVGGGPDLWVIPDSGGAVGGRISPALVAIYNAAPDNLYFNVHTAANSNGEIRGQLDASGAVRLATLGGAQETPPVTTAAVGGGIVVVDTATGRVGGFVTTSVLTGTAAHIHNAARGVAGPILVPLLAGP